MKTIDEKRLEDDLEYRFGYITEFMGFGEEDIAAIHGSAELLAPLVETVVDAVYDKLHAYSATWRHFVPRQEGYEGDVPENLEDLGMDHAQIAFRKSHLSHYLVQLVTAPYDGKLLRYLDQVGRIHTPASGNSDIDVPLVQMNALMGYVSDIVISTLMAADLPDDVRTATVRAFNRLLWIQNDLISRHYVATD